MRPAATHQSKCVLAILASGLAACAGEMAEDDDDAAPLELGQLESAMTATTDTLEGYAAKCDEATGIHVPTFSCKDGVEVPQGYQARDENLDDMNIGMVTDGQRNPVPPTGHEIIATGNDFWETTDRFHLSRVHDGSGDDITGDGFYDVYVESLSYSHQYAKAGLMFRTDDSLGSPHVAVVITPGGGAQFQKRLTPNANASNETLVGYSPPVWLRLRRLGNTFTGYVSRDRIDWTQVGSPVNFTFGTTPLSGLAVASHNPSQSTTAVVDHFSWTQLPYSRGNYCDAPNVLNGECDPGSRFLVLAQTQDAMAVANCRKKDQAQDSDLFDDIAVIQYSRQTGALCFYQSPLGAGIDGTNMTAPSLGQNDIWLSPADTHANGCTGCHDNGGFIRSPYITQLVGDGFPEVGSSFRSWFAHNQNFAMARYVGLDFLEDKSWAVFTANAAGDNESSCSSCHFMGVNNHLRDGTSINFGGVATAGSQSAKSEHDEFAPIWMRPEKIEWTPAAYDTSQRYRTCASGFWGSRLSSVDHGFEMGDPVDGCLFMEIGGALLEPSNPSASANIGITNGTHSQDYEEHTITARGADIYNNSDQFFMRYFFALPSDGSATVRVTGLANANPATTDPWAKAGLMFRHGEAANSTNVMMTMTAGNGASFQYRTTTGGSTTQSNVLGYGVGSWLRLTRAGNTFTGYVSQDQETWVQVGPPVTIHDFSQSPLLGLAVTSHNVNLSTTAKFDHFTWTPATTNTWVQQDIGSVGSTYRFSTGPFVYGSGANGVHTITNRGADIWGNSDEFLFSYQGLQGDGEIVARVTGLVNTDPYAKAGVMFRRSAAPNTRNAAMVITAAQGSSFQARVTPAGSTLTTFGPGAAPQWVRLVRAGDTFTGYVSATGAPGDWGSPVGSQTISGFGETALVGLAVTSHNTGATTTATFTDVRISN